MRPWRRIAVAVAMLALISWLLGACGSSSSTASTTIKHTCKEVEAVLSDGPEPAADPIGYAQAQILPLRQIRTSDKQLRKAIDGLASAYQAVSAEHHAGHKASDAVTVATDSVNAICPGAAS